ncbi:MAG TPA: FAD-dependent oxidoreductase [bacterium]|nr:FAD-dependent oxidoreductase [bacterium]
MSRTVVIGAGVIGLTCAYALNRRGERVTVLDAGEPGAACSLGNAGWVCPSFSGPVPGPGVLGRSLRWLVSPDSPLVIRPRADFGFLGWLALFMRSCNTRAYRAGLEATALLNARTMALFDALASDGVRFEMHREGILFVFLDRAAMSHVTADLERMRAFGYTAGIILSAKEVREREPMLSDAIVGGVLAPEERHVRPETLTQGLVAALRETGVEIDAHRPATGLRQHRGGTSTRVTTGVETRDGALEADHIVIAAGAWSGLLTRMAGCRVPLQAGKGYSITLAGPASQIRRPLYLDEAKIACSNFDGVLRLAGTMELAGHDTTLDARRVDAMRRNAGRYLVRWSRADREVTWTGLRSMTPDGLPMIGRLPGHDNLYIAAGHAMLGVTLAPATADALAELITTGRSSVDLSAFDPGRFGRSREPRFSQLPC